MTNPDKIATRLKIVQDVLNVYYGRSGFDEWWDSIEPEIQAEIETELTKIIYAE